MYGVFGILVGNGLSGRQAYAQERLVEALRKELAASKGAFKRTAEENSKLRQMMGFDATTSFKDIESAFEADMKTHGAKVPEERRTYRGLLDSKFAEIREMKDRNGKLEEETQSVKKELGNAVQADRGDSRSEGQEWKEAFDRLRTQLIEENTKLKERLLQERKQAVMEREQLITRLKQCSETIARLHAVLVKHGIDPKETAAAGTATRTWKDPTGRFEVEAALVEVKDGTVVLRKTDGKVLRVPLLRLSNACREYVRQSQAEAPPTD